MYQNKYGEIAENQWYWIGKRYSYIALHAFVVMPNHIHAIIEINRQLHRDDVVGTGRDLSLPLPSRRPQKIKSLSELIGAYKMTVSKQIHLLGYHEFQWQRSFHDHIIRDKKSFQNIKNYINNNPSNWNEDRFHEK